MAGLRTNALVVIVAPMFVMLAMPTPDNSMRLAAQVVSGIGFLGWCDHAREIDGTRP